MQCNQQNTNNLHDHLKEEEDEFDDQEDDAISLSDLPTHHHSQGSESVNQYSITDDSIDFSFTFEATPINNKLNDSVSSTTTKKFGGKVRPTAISPFDDLYYNIGNNNKNSSSFPHSSLPSMKSKSCPGPSAPRSYSYSSCSRKHKVLIGLAKLPTTMELSDIKKRQSRRRNPGPTFPAVAAAGDGERKVARAGDNNEYCAGESQRRRQWVTNPVRRLRFGAHLANVLAKAKLGCFSPS